LIVSLAGTAVGSLITGLAGGLGLLLVGRIVDGGSGASVAVAQAAAADLAPRGERARLFGFLGAAFGVGFVAGPAIGAAAALGGPRLPFFLAAGIAAVNTVVAAFRLPETRRPQPRLTTPLASWRRAAPLVGVAFTAMVAFSGFEATFAIFGQHRLGFGISSAAAVFTVVGAVIVAVQVGLVHPIVRRIGELRTLAGGLVANAAGLVTLAGAHSWAVVIPALLVLTVGQGLVQPTMSSALVGRADPARRGQFLGIQQSASSLGRVIGPLLAGALLGSEASGAPYLVGAALTAAAVLMLLAGVVAWKTRPGDPSDNGVDMLPSGNNRFSKGVHR
jgi:DHA1 family tetracycline resistance protein-like MFS transporter